MAKVCGRLHDELRVNGWVAYGFSIEGKPEHARVFSDYALDLVAGNVKDIRVYPLTEVEGQERDLRGKHVCGLEKGADVPVEKVRAIYVMPAKGNTNKDSVVNGAVQLIEGGYVVLHTNALKRSIRKDE